MSVHVCIYYLNISLQLVFESGDYFIQHIWRCGDNSIESSV